MNSQHHHHHENSQGASPRLVPVRFEFTDPAAKSVCVAGSFNHWQPASKTLHPSGNGLWLKDTELAPGSYEYCLVVDGKWMADPLAKDQVPNPYGGRNSVLNVAIPAVSAAVADSAGKPKSTQGKQNTKRA